MPDALYWVTVTKIIQVATMAATAEEAQAQALAFAAGTAQAKATMVYSIQSSAPVGMPLVVEA
jgi:hypothetical protein